MALFSAILKKNTIKTPEVILDIRLRVLRLSSSFILQKYLYASFSFSYGKYSCILSIFSVVFAYAHVVLLTTQKSRRAEKKFHNARSLQENNVPLSSQSERAYYCSHIIKSGNNDPSWKVLETVLIPFDVNSALPCGIKSTPTVPI